MHVDVDFVVRHFKKQQCRGENIPRQNVAIGFVNGVQDQTVAHQPSIDENIDAVAIGALHFRPRSEPGNRERGFFFAGFELRFGHGGTKRRRYRRHLHQFFQRLPAEELIHAVRHFLRGRAIDDGLRRRG